MKNIKILIAAIVIILIAAIAVIIYYESQKIDKAFSGITEKAYVAVEGSGEIAVIDIKTNVVLKKIDLSKYKNGKIIGYMPHNVQVAPNNKSVWITANAMDKEMKMSVRIIPRAEADTGHGIYEANNMEKSSDEVIVIDPLTDSVIKRIEIGRDLHLSHVALTPDSDYAIVAAQEKGVIYKINAVTFMVEKEVVVKKEAGPHGLRISPDGQTAYVAMIEGRSLGVLDIESFNLKDISLKGKAVQTGVTPDGKYVLISVYDAKSLAVYDIASDKLSYIDLPKEANGPVQIYPSPDSRYVYIADQGYYFNQPVGSLVYKVDLQKMEVVQAILSGTAPHGIVVSRDGKFVYVTNLLSDDVSVIDTAIKKEITKIKVGKMPNGISLWYLQEANSGATISSNGNYSELMSEEKTFDFGTVSMANGKVSHVFKIKNIGNAPANIIKIYTSCMCTEAVIINGKSRKGPFGMLGHGGFSSKINEAISPGEEIIIDVSVDPAAHGPQGTGPAKKIVYIESDSAISPILELLLDINVVR